MKKLFAILLFLPLLFSCSKEDSSGDFQYTVSGSSQAEISGTNCRFGPSTGTSYFIAMTSGVDNLNLKILLNPLVPGEYMVNALYVNGMFIPTMPGDASGELQLGSVFSGSQKFFNTYSGDGGRVTVTSVDGNVLKGNFQVSMLELVGGTPGNEPKINVAGEFTAIMQ